MRQDIIETRLPQPLAAAFTVAMACMLISTCTDSAWTRDETLHALRRLLTGPRRDNMAAAPCRYSRIGV